MKSNNNTGKCIVVAVHATKTKGDMVDVLPDSILTLVLHEGGWSTSGPGSFNTRNEPKYPLNRRLGGFQSQSGHFRGKSLVPTEIPTPE
jgi:hypothetical protein